MKYDIVIGDKKYVVEVDSANVNILGKSDIEIANDFDDEFDDIPDFDFDDDADENSTSVQSPIFGTVVAVKVNSGDNVKKGDVILIIESMKMENEIYAPSDGLIDKILVNQGDSVKKNQNLMSINCN